MSADQTKKTFVLKGVGVSPGVAIGSVYRFDPLDSKIAFYKLNDASLIPKEILRFKKALKESEQSTAGNSKKSQERKSYRTALCY